MESNSGSSTAPPPLDAKYHKLAAEYSKIRAQANVLKRALIEEQNKSSCLRESQRIRDTALRRAEQEVDSLGFRNKQLEHRVAALQEDLDRESKRPQKNAKSKSNVKITNDPAAITDPVFTEELQKKIIENAQLVSLVADKNAEIQLYSERINELEQRTARKQIEHTDVEKRLRREIDTLVIKNGSLEQRLAIDSSSVIGSDDTISVADSDHNTPVHQTNHASPTTAAAATVVLMNVSHDEKMVRLEKEIFHLRTKLDFFKICDTTTVSSKGECASLTIKEKPQTLCNGASSVSPCTAIAVNDDVDGETSIASKDQLIYNHFSAKLDGLFTEKAKAESKVVTFKTECESLQSNLEFINTELADTEHRLMHSQRQLQISEEDLATTRYNYEEQISVLTEQVINLSDQLASLK